jgi:hypothetical protein
MTVRRRRWGCRAKPMTGTRRQWGCRSELKIDDRTVVDNRCTSLMVDKATPICNRSVSKLQRASKLSAVKPTRERKQIGPSTNADQCSTPPLSMPRRLSTRILSPMPQSTPTCRVSCSVAPVVRQEGGASPGDGSVGQRSTPWLLSTNPAVLGLKVPRLRKAGFSGVRVARRRVGFRLRSLLALSSTAQIVLLRYDPTN